jgi:hypothetical protein
MDDRSIYCKTDNVEKKLIARKAAIKVGIKVFFPASVINDVWNLSYGIYLGWKRYK